MMKFQYRRTRATVLAGGLLFAGAALTQGCLQREVVKQDPNTSNVFVEQIVNNAINEIDLLFVIDNSVSMADKQDILAVAVPQMVERLVNPLCKNEAGDVQTNPGDCAALGAGWATEFNPVDDIHIGVISSSLGGHGARLCPRVEEGWNNDDQGHLMASVRPGLIDDPAGSGFLSWLPPPDADPAERAALSATLKANFTAHVEATGENGCGFEAPLEAWYRFLIDPQPPFEMVVDPATNRAAMTTDAEGNPLIDGTVLQQRDAFLRPEGLVAIVVLTDENDCSAMDGGSYYNNAGFGYLVAEASFQMPIATPECETNPNSACCFSCLQKGSPPEGCSAAVCEGAGKLPPEQDRANSRCFQNKRRFGVDLLYPTQRYVDALTKSEIVDARNGTLVDNPLLRGTTSNKGKSRDPGLVFFAGIVGVPWQDVATDESLTNPGLMQYRTAVELTLKDVDVGGAKVNRWDVILGQPGLAESDKRCSGSGEPSCGVAPTPALDPFMVESILPRTVGAANPISGDLIASADSSNPTENGINGHEANHGVVDPLKFADGMPANDDLQYACTFLLENPKPNCTAENLSCDCGDEPLRNRPLCQPPGGGAAAKTQYFGKAYPGTRILEVLRDFGENSIVGSICPKIATGTDISNPNFGYNPAVQAIVDRLAEKLGGKCLPRELSVLPDGSVPCSVVEAAPAVAENGPQLNCAGNGRAEVPAEIRPAVEKQLEAAGRCDGNTLFKCSTYQMCVIKELIEQPGRGECLTNAGDASAFPSAGFCYIDPAKGPNAGGQGEGCDPDDETTWTSCTNEIVKNCPATERRLLRFVGDETPAPNTVAFVACVGDNKSVDDPIPPPANAVAGTGGSGTPSTGTGGNIGVGGAQ